jgi:hypothetical protein
LCGKNRKYYGQKCRECVGKSVANKCTRCREVVVSNPGDKCPNCEHMSKFVDSEMKQ